MAEPKPGDLWLTEVGHLPKGSEVTVIGEGWVDGANKTMKVTWSGGTGYVWSEFLTDTKPELKWDAPRERKDIAELLMAKVQAYRKSKGLRQWEDPYVYYNVNNPGLGERMKADGLRVAKSSCLAKTSTHEGGQIGVGWYGPDERPSAEKVAEVLYKGWYDSPGHNANMLGDHSSLNEVDVALMTVVEYYDGTYWNYCAIMSDSMVVISTLPDGLK